jgi:hypothetical protein
MTPVNKKPSPIAYSCYVTRSREGEQFIPEHVFSYQVSGTMTMNDGNMEYIFRPGSFRFSRRNHLIKFNKLPPEGGEFKSFSVYFDQPFLRNFSMEAGYKAERHMREAILLLFKVNPETKDILFDFSEPGKIDLEAFMNKNFHFNVDLNRFAYLTGRSLATFKRDFEKIFGTSPNRWLQQRRLREA